MTEGIDRWRGPNCPSCGAMSEPGERFCWQCGGRLPRRANAAFIPVVVGVACLGLFVALAALVDSDGATTSSQPTATLPMTTSSSTPLTATAEVGVLPVSQVTCTHALETHPCSFLIDGDRSTAWNAPRGGVGAEIVITLNDPAQLSRLVLTNHADDAALFRNARVSRLIIHFEGSDEVVDVAVEGSHGPYRIPLPLVYTSSISIHVEGVHPSEDYGGQPAFGELALAEIAVIGFSG